MALSKYSQSYVEEMLQCSVCLDTVREPQTLQNCLHSYCKECTDQLQHKQKNQPPGVKCLLCGQFSGKDEIRSNFFIKDLADMHLSSQASKKPVCEQCPEDNPNEASLKCLDCKCYLCQPCQIVHLRMKMMRGHRILPLSDETELVVDQLVLCQLHQDQSVLFYCRPCNLPLCIKCKVTRHDDHKTETVEEALERIVPQIEKDGLGLDEHIETLCKSVGEIDEKIEETNSSFADCCKDIDQIAEEMKKDIEANQKHLKNELNKKEQEEIKKLQDAKEFLLTQQKESENLKRVVRTSLDRARHATLLTELVQGGICNKIQSIKENKKQTPAAVNISHPQLKESNKKWSSLKQDGVLGSILYNMMSIFFSMGAITTMKLQQGPRHWCGKFQELLAKPLQMVLEIKLPVEGYRFSIINNEVWVPIYSGNINIYNLDGQFARSINVESPHSVEQAFNGHIFVACHENKGLYFIFDKEQPQKLCDGSFSDVCGLQDKMYALDFDKKCVLEFCYNQGGKGNLLLNWTQIKQINLNYTHPHYGDSFVVFQDQTGLNILLACYLNHRIDHYNKQGENIKQYGRNAADEAKLDSPMICGIDNEDNVLVGGMITCNTLNLSTGQVTPTTFEIENNNYLFHVKLDNEGFVWMAEWKKYDFFITKYKRNQ